MTELIIETLGDNVRRKNRKSNPVAIIEGIKLKWLI